MLCVMGGMLIGSLLGGLIAQQWGVTAPWWFAFVGSGLTLALVWRAAGEDRARGRSGHDSAT